jgi:FkbM family methyltransferase
MYRKGCTGVLVEPNPKKWQALKAARPNDTSLNIGADDKEGVLPFYILPNDQHNTFDEKQAEEDCKAAGWDWEKVKTNTIKIPVRHINDIIKDHFEGKAPDYISIDVQGWELKLLKALDLTRYRPPVICIETIVANKLAYDPAFSDYIIPKEYEPRGGSMVNTVYVDKKLIYS